MAYEMMYEGDGFIRKGPVPKGAGKQEAPAETNRTPEKKPARRERGSSIFRFARLVFGR